MNEQQYISEEAVKTPQPEVLADLQLRRLKKIGFVNNEYF